MLEVLVKYPMIIVCFEGMKSSIKTQLAKLLAEVLRYYFFDRYSDFIG